MANKPQRAYEVQVYFREYVITLSAETITRG
jgi:hypothetical protein